MDKDRVDGVADKIAGSMKEAIGKVTGDIKLQAEGTAQKSGGIVQDKVGKANDADREVVKE